MNVRALLLIGMVILDSINPVIDTVIASNQLTGQPQVVYLPPHTTCGPDCFEGLPDPTMPIKETEIGGVSNKTPDPSPQGNEGSLP